MSDLLTAIDAYMKSNGKGTNYLAKKMGDFFESDESPFNVKDGVVKKLADKIEVFTDSLNKIAISLNRTFVNQGDEMGSFFKSLKHNFSSTFTEHARKDGSEYRVHAIDVNLVHIKDSVYDTFFQHFQKRFSSESVLSKPDVSGHSHRIHSMDVNVKTMDKSLLETIKKGLTNDVVIENNDKEKGGVLSSILGWIANAGMLLGGLFLLGKGKQFLDNTALGKNIKVIFDKITSGISRWITKYLDSGDIGNTFADGITIISDTFSFIWNSIATFFHRNEKSIQKNFNTVKDTVWNKVLYPIFFRIKKFIQETNWGEILKTIGGFMWSHILKPYFSSIGESLEQGDFMGAAGKAALGLSVALAPFATGIGSLTLAVGSIVLSPLSIALVALGASFGLLYKTVSDAIESVDSYDNMLSRSLASSERQKGLLGKESKKLQKNLSDLQKRTTGDSEDVRTLKIRSNILESKINAIRKDELTKTTLIEKKSSEDGFFGKLFNSAYYESQIRDIRSEHSKQIEKLLPELSSVYKKLKSIDTKEPEKVDDAVVVQPHSKDQILMAKNGGPFDLALKKMIEKMDEEIQILSHGFTILAEATLMGSNNVTNAVVATAGATSGGTQQSNRNPGADFRAKALDRLRR